jgi:Cys-rich protein (TIGR01571 family)
MNGGSSSYTPVSLQETLQGSFTIEDADHPLQESLVTNPASIPAASFVPVLQIEAPATLPEGYELSVIYGENKESLKVKVPAGGIEKGQTFTVPFPEQLTHATSMMNVSIPVGSWRDGLFEFFKHGFCHPHLWTTWLCTLLATGQVIRRMGLDWEGNPTDSAQRKAAAFPTLLVIVVVYFAVHLTIYFVMVSVLPDDDEDAEDEVKEYEDGEYHPEDEEEEPPPAFFILYFLYRFWHLVYWVGSTIVLVRTRRSVRQRYGIPGDDAEDCVCAIACHCCVASQLLRHTTNYDVYPSYSCESDTGLPPHVPAIL